MTRFLMWPVWWLTVLATIASGAFWAHRATTSTWSNTPGPLAHVEAAGAHAASALVLVAAVVALEAFDGPRMCRRIALAAAAVFLVLGVRGVLFLTDVALNEDPGAFTDGVGEPLAAPWAWLLLASGLWGWARIRAANRRSGNTTGAGLVLTRR